MFSVFLNVDYLDVQLPHYVNLSMRGCLWNIINLKDMQKHSAVLNYIMKSGCNLTSSELKLPLSKLIAEGTQFFEALPK